MEHSKLYQYKDVAKVSAFDYSGKLAVKTTEDNQYDVSSPVNTAENYSVNEDIIVLSNTLDNEEPMKFSFSFKVNKSAIGTGTNLLLDMPGLFSVKSENNTLWFKFYYEDAPAWKYINASELVDGWNNVSLVGDGVKVTLTVNSTVHTVLDSSSVYPSLSLGILKTYQSWLCLKDIEALKIESTKPDDQEGGKPQGKDAYQEIQYPIDQTIVDNYTSKLSSGMALFTAVYNGVRLYLHTSNTYSDPSKEQVISMTAYTGTPGRKNTKEVGRLEGKDKDGAWIYEYRDYGADTTIDTALPRAKFLAWKA